MDSPTYPGLGKLKTANIAPSWEKAEIGLEHAVSGDIYWLQTQVIFYAAGKVAKYVGLGGCGKSDPELAAAFLVGVGFRRTTRRYNREWEYWLFER